MNECIRCGGNRFVERHHIFPKACGGTDNARNVMPLCRECHDKQPIYSDTNFLGANKVVAYRIPRNLHRVISDYAYYHRMTISQAMINIVSEYFTSNK